MPLLLSLLLALTFAPLAESRILHGDWESAGAPTPPYEPPFDYAYSCQAQLTNRETRQVAPGRKGRLYAVARFTLRKGAAHVASEDLSWFWIALTKDGDELPHPGGAFSLQGHGAGIWFSGPDSVALRVFVELPIGDYAVSESAIDRGDRASEVLHARVSAFSYLRKSRSNLPRQLQRSLSVRCEKIR